MCPSELYDKACNQSFLNAAVCFSVGAGEVIKKKMGGEENTFLIKYRLMVGSHLMCKWDICMTCIGKEKEL